MVLRVCAEEGKGRMREWLSGGVSPCQGEGRGFESRLVLFVCQKGFLQHDDVLKNCRAVYYTGMNTYLVSIYAIFAL